MSQRLRRRARPSEPPRPTVEDEPTNVEAPDEGNVSSGTGELSPPPELTLEQIREELARERTRRIELEKELARANDRERVEAMAALERERNENATIEAAIVRGRDTPSQSPRPSTAALSIRNVPTELRASLSQRPHPRPLTEQAEGMVREVSLEKGRPVDPEIRSETRHQPRLNRVQAVPTQLTIKETKPGDPPKYTGKSVTDHQRCMN